jgi:hypothetical protein
MRGVRA